jgi:FAD/FMN-containing dehydrogenase
VAQDIEHASTPHGDQALSSSMVIFGAGGDLTKRLLMPALYNLARTGLLPAQFALVGLDRIEQTDAQYRDHVEAAIRAFALHRLGDFALVVSLFALHTSLGSLSFEALLAGPPTLEPWSRVADVGVFGGLAHRTLWFIAGSGVVMAAATRSGLWCWPLLRDFIDAVHADAAGGASLQELYAAVESLVLARAGPALLALGELRINCFGHLGDGNLHYNVFPQRGRTRAQDEPIREPVKRVVHDMVHAMGGSVSAEHGIGRLKVGDLERYGDPAKLAAMRAIKAALDPAGIMNPGAVLRG